MMEIQLSKNFKLSEFTYSETAQKFHISNLPRPEHIEHLKDLCITLLQPLRDAWGKPLRISSGYRCERLNNAVGGSKTSAHKTGYAADILPVGDTIDNLIAFVREWLPKSGILFDQCIIEKKNKTRWIHTGLYSNSGRQRKQIFNITL